MERQDHLWFTIPESPCTIVNLDLRLSVEERREPYWCRELQKFPSVSHLRKPKKTRENWETGPLGNPCPVSQKLKSNALFILSTCM
ncbi:hypothetical protein L208DRAFT_1399481 [Tricholoma matsutake]|nr:hypothetical protein L208DRAFT_1399481 [Tricholoma matsutake 945]